MDDYIDSASIEVDNIKKVQKESKENLKRVKNFDSADLLNETRMKMASLISNQRQIELLKKHEEYQNASVVIEKEQMILKFTLKVSELEKCREERLVMNSEDAIYSLSIIQNEHNVNGFEVFFKRNFFENDNIRYIPKISFEKLRDMSIILGNFETALTKKDPEAKIGKLLLISEDLEK